MNECVMHDVCVQMKEVLTENFRGIHMSRVEEKENIRDSLHYLERYLAAKKLEGCSDKTLAYYKTTIEKLLLSVNKNVCEITTEELRIYLSSYQCTHNNSMVTIDNIRRIISGFFSWLEDEDYIVKSPARRIHKVKTAHLIKETFTDENLEELRNACEELRDLAIIEFLSSTGVRIGELVQIDRNNINYYERSCIVLGKGNKQREVYFDARTKLHLQEYIATRKDNERALFVSLNKPYKRLSASGVEKIIKKIGAKTEIERVYPHKFRRSLATMAIDKGMPIEQVQKLLGHVRIDTTMHYAMVNQSNVKMAHRKYIG